MELRAVLAAHALAMRARFAVTVLHCRSGRCSFVSSLVILLNSCSWADFHFEMQRETTKDGMVVSKSLLPAHVVKGIQNVLARFSSAQGCRGCGSCRSDCQGCCNCCLSDRLDTGIVAVN